MKQPNENQCIKPSHKDYSYAFKLALVQEVEIGELGKKAATRKYGIQSNSTVFSWLRKYGNSDWINKSTLEMPRSKTTGFRVEGSLD